MPLQNRVDPFGKIHAVPSRGAFTGNRGVIHDPATRSLLKRRWTTKAWLICVCDFRGRRREVMGRNSARGSAGWTELFFLDEPTALAAGHRPCFFCRRERAEAFADALSPLFSGRRPKAPEIDSRLHGERMVSGGTAIPIDPASIADLPDGAFVADGDAAYAVRGGRVMGWRFAGYAPREPPSAIRWRSPILLTPATTLAALRGGYRPMWSAGAPLS